MQLLFLWDTHNAADRATADQLLQDGSDDAETRRRALEMAAGTWEQRATIDKQVEKLAPQWPPRRQPAVDRAIIRLAIHEITSTDIDAPIVIDEAIELARQFSTEQSASFVNGVLDAALREHSELTGKPMPVRKMN